MSNLADATTKIVAVLDTFNSEERLRIVKASLLLLGDDFNPFIAKTSNPAAEEKTQEKNDSDTVDVPVFARTWMKKNTVTSEQLEQYFHFDQDTVTPIALLGKATGRKEQTINAYLTVGLASLLRTGEASFADSDAREFCVSSGCYDQGNHATTVKAFGNRITGSKSAGWKLTAPGLSSAADLIKQSTI